MAAVGAGRVDVIGVTTLANNGNRHSRWPGAWAAIASVRRHNRMQELRRRRSILLGSEIIASPRHARSRNVVVANSIVLRDISQPHQSLKISSKEQPSTPRRETNEVIADGNCAARRQIDGLINRRTEIRQHASFSNRHWQIGGKQEVNSGRNK